jgi:hypothetical protein
MGVGGRRVGWYGGMGIGSVGTVVVLVLYNREHDNIGSRRKRMVEYLLVDSRLLGSGKNGGLEDKARGLL